MMRSPVLLLAGAVFACVQAPPEAVNRAVVETRPPPPARQAQKGNAVLSDKVVAENRQGVERPRMDAAEAIDAELKRTIERQSRRIAELESRAATDAESRQVLELVAHSQRMGTLRAEDQAHELTAANQDYGRDPGPYTRLRLALTLATPGTSFNDDTRAATLLEPVVSQAVKSPSPLRQFAVLVHGLVSERLREQKRVAQLKEQIDGLRAIDRALIERDQGRGP